MEKIRILRILNRFNIGGPVFNAIFLTKFIGEEFETLLVGGEHYKGEASALPVVHSYGVNPVVLRSVSRRITPHHDIPAFIKILGIIREFQPHLIHTHASKAGFFGRMVKALKLWNCPVIHTYHGHVFKGYFGKITEKALMRIEKFLSLYTSQIIVPSSTIKNEISHILKINQEKISVIPLAIDLARFPFFEIIDKIKEKERVGMANRLTVGWCGRLTKIKDPFLFIDIIQVLKREFDYPVTAIIQGGGAPEFVAALKEYARKLNLTITEGTLSQDTDICIAGWQLNPVNFYEICDFLLITSINEGTPLTALEAMATGTVVISTPVGGLPDIIKTGINGFLTFSRSPAEFVSIINTLILNRDLYEGIRQKARNYIKSEHSVESLISKTRDLYFNLLKF